MFSGSVFAVWPGLQIKPLGIFVIRSQSEGRMVGECSISGKEIRGFQSLNGIRHLVKTGRFKVTSTTCAYMAFVIFRQASGERGRAFIRHLALGDAIGVGDRLADGHFLLWMLPSLKFINGSLEMDGFWKHSIDGMVEAWFLDQFGVLHDGRNPYPGAITTLEKLASHGAKMVIISNSSRRASTTIEKLKSLGFDTSLFHGAITSGELTHQYLQRRDDSWFVTLGRSCIHMTWSDRGAISLEGLGLQVVERIEDANFILAHGTEALGLPSGDARPMKLEDLEHVLELCAENKIPMVVANPDYVTVEARDLRVMPGMLAAKYEKLGGEVKWMGKPDKLIYQSAIAMASVDTSDCIAVGDSLHHDIKGANAAGIQSVFITGGIHATELGLGSYGEAAESTAVEALASTHNAHPSYILPAFTW